MAELKEEQPEADPVDKRQVSYENALHPLHAKKSQKEQPLIDLGSDIAQKSIHFVEKLFSDSSASNSENESAPSSSKVHKKMPQKTHHRQHENYVPEDPSSLSQELPVPPNATTPDLSATRAADPTGIYGENARKEFDENLSTIVSMFPNIEPGVCFMILQASEGKLSETIER